MSKRGDPRMSPWEYRSTLAAFVLLAMAGVAVASIETLRGHLGLRVVLPLAGLWLTLMAAPVFLMLRFPQHWVRPAGRSAAGWIPFAVKAGAVVVANAIALAFYLAGAHVFVSVVTAFVLLTLVDRASERWFARGEKDPADATR